MCLTSAPATRPHTVSEKPLQARGAGAAHALKRRGGDPDAEQIGQRKHVRNGMLSPIAFEHYQKRKLQGV
jgi:hypothetical protein